MATHQTTPAAHDEHVDSWHDHTGEALPQQAHTDDVPAFRVLGFGLMLYMAVVAVIVIISIYFYTTVDKMKVTSEEYPELRADGSVDSSAALHFEAIKLKDGAHAAFTSDQSEWVDVEAGTVRLPLNQAKSKVIERYGQK